MMKNDPMLQLKIHCQDGAIMPQYAYTDDVGLDVTVIRYQCKSKIYFFDTGLCVEPPDGYYIELLPRSSIVWKGWIMPNSVGVIDPNYRGTLQIPLRWLGEGGQEQADNQAKALLGERIAQIIIRPIIKVQPIQVTQQELSTSDRGQGAFGSSGTGKSSTDS